MTSSITNTPAYTFVNPQRKQDIFIEVDYYQHKKKGEAAPGDVFLSQKNQCGSRIITTLSDGLGSGIKANVLASLTATMLTKFVLMDIPLRRAAEIIINTLPVCRDRGLGYATFTLVDARHDMSVRIIEYDNPPILIVRDNKSVGVDKKSIPLKRKNKKTGPQNEQLYYTTFTALPGDRFIFFTDGVTQAGLGMSRYPNGWGLERACEHILQTIREQPDISAGDLAARLVLEAEKSAGTDPKDDTSCGVIYFRKPRDLLVITGPPFRPENDKELARIFTEFKGKKIISGGTSAQIIARELGKTIGSPGVSLDPNIPAAAQMEGADLVCEGILTLSAVAEELSAGTSVFAAIKNPASQMRKLLLDSDRITFVVGTKINEIHQDPTMPVELEIRRNVVKKIADLLEENYMKAAHLWYI
jgi:hypothetical protein